MRKSFPLSPTDGFVLSRVDGTLDEEDLAESTGLPEAQVQASLAKLEAMGLISFDGGPPAHLRRARRWLGPARRLVGQPRAAAASPPSTSRPPTARPPALDRHAPGATATRIHQTPPAQPAVSIPPIDPRGGGGARRGHRSRPRSSKTGHRGLSATSISATTTRSSASRRAPTRRSSSERTSSSPPPFTRTATSASGWGPSRSAWRRSSHD